MGDKLEKDEEWTESYDANITRVDLVPAPANGVDFILAKNAGMISPEQVEELLAKASKEAESPEDEEDDSDVEDGDGDKDEDEQEGVEKSAPPKQADLDADIAAFVKAHGDHTFQYVDHAEDGSVFVKRTFTSQQRADLAKSGAALPDGSYPIENGGDLHNAIHAVGRGSNHSHAEIHSHIIKRAKSLGLKAMLPKSWGQGGMAKSAEGTLSVDVDSDAFKKALDEATASLRKASEERVTTLEAELKKMQDTPVPGGPMLAPPGSLPAQPRQPEQSEAQKQAAHFRKMAQQDGLDSTLRDRYLAAAKTLESGS